MHEIVILGTGNLATHLFEAFTQSEVVSVIQVYGRNPKALSHFQDRTETTTDPDKLRKADVYLCAVSDDAIQTVAQYPKDRNAILVHCSGAVPISTLPEGSRRGVFYPLQTFSKGRDVDFATIPICLEAEQDEVMEVLMALGKAISDSCISISSKQRSTLHLAAVFTNNFTNHLLYRAGQLCEEHQLPLSLLKPLLKETVNKLDSLSPFDAQTGPARRGDMQTEEKHMALLQDHRDQEIYRVLSQAIQETYGD